MSDRAVRWLVFSYNDWDDDAPRGWHALVLKSAAATLEDVRKEIVVAALADEPGQSQAFGDDYHIVSLDELRIVEEGALETTWDATGNRFQTCDVVPKQSAITK